MAMINEVLLAKTVKIPVASHESFQQVCKALYSVGCGEVAHSPDLIPDIHCSTNVIGVVVMPTGGLSLCFKGEEEYFTERSGVQVDEADVLALDPDILIPRMKKHNKDRANVLRAKHLYDLFSNKMRDHSLTEDQLDLIETALSKG